MRRTLLHMNENETTTISGGSATARARTSGLRRCRGEAAPKGPGAAAAFGVGMVGLFVLIIVAALAPVEAAGGGLRGAGNSTLLMDWSLRCFGIALCAAVAGSLLTASGRDWRRLAEQERGGTGAGRTGHASM